METAQMFESEVFTEPQRNSDPYRETVNRLYTYLDGLPGGARQAWQEAAYQSFLADRLERKT
jgi:hypothetical protein